MRSFFEEYARELKAFRRTRSVTGKDGIERAARNALSALKTLSDADFARTVAELTPGQQAILDVPWSVAEAFVQDLDRPCTRAPLDRDFVLGAPTMGGYNEESGGGIFRWTEHALAKQSNGSPYHTPSFTTSHQSILRHCVSECAALHENLVDGAALHLGVRIQARTARDIVAPGTAPAQAARSRDVWRVLVSPAGGGDGVTCCMTAWRDDHFAANVVTAHVGVRLGVPDLGTAPRSCLVVRRTKEHSPECVKGEALSRAVLLSHCWAFNKALEEGVECVCVVVDPVRTAVDEIAVLARLAKYQRVFPFGACPKASQPLFQPHRLFWVPPRRSDKWMLRPTPTRGQLEEMVAACVCRDASLTEKLYRTSGEGGER
tara:strand:+ start:163 stop:1287 length:1125 start_codon:yes stop_codon:yes gene_type:complete